MSTNGLHEYRLVNSPRFLARMTGVFYLFTILAGIFAQGFVSGRLIVSGDAAATATNILTHRSLFGWGFTAYMIEMVCNVAITALFYVLLRPVSRTVSLLAAFLGLSGCVIKTVSRVFYLAPLFLLGGHPYLAAFRPEQLQSFALLMLTVNDHGAGVALVFFGFGTLLKGYLIYESNFLPRVFGVLSVIAGIGWIAFLSPTLGYRVFPYIAGLGILVSLAFIVWLVVFGVDEAKWHEQARTVSV